MNNVEVDILRGGLSTLKSAEVGVSAFGELSVSQRAVTSHLR